MAGRNRYVTAQGPAVAPVIQSTGCRGDYYD